MKNVEPLLKDEVETFPFLNDNKKPEKNKKTNKVKKEMIITIIVSIVVVLFVGKSLYPFYVGFVHFDEGHTEKKEDDTKKSEEKEISLDSLYLDNIYNSINITNTNEISDLLDVFYGSDLLTKESLTSEQKLSLVFSKAGINCQNLELDMKLEDIKNIAKNLFNEDEFVNVITNTLSFDIGTYQISKTEENDVYHIVSNACFSSDNYTFRSLYRASTKDDYETIDVYEYFGLFIKNEDGIYVVYKNALQTDAISDYNDDITKLGIYKWTFKKSNDNNYYFVSITPQI